MNKRIEKLENTYRSLLSGFGGPPIGEIIDKINEIVDVLNGEQKEPNVQIDTWQKRFNEQKQMLDDLAEYYGLREQKEQTLEEKSEIPTNLDELLDDYFEALVVPEHQIIFEDTYRKIATDFFRMGQGASEKPMNLDLEIEIEDTRLEFCDEVDGITIEIIAKRFYELGRNAK